MSQTSIDPGMRKSDKLIPWYFVLCFLVVFAVNAVFIYYAETTHSGLVTKQAYEKGLSYDETLKSAKEQEALEITQEARFENGTLIWQLIQKDGTPLTGAQVDAKLIRAVKAGHDFEVNLTPAADGVYVASLDLPLPGAWTAKLEATWDNQTYQTTYKFQTE